MEVKIDTREKFHVITIPESLIAANMTEKMDKALMPLLDQNVKNVIINMKDTKIADNAAALHLIALQNRFYKEGASFVFCELSPESMDVLHAVSGAEPLNFTPTESEAMDIVQMEEIERELGAL